jgi:CBS domain-containing protein
MLDHNCGALAVLDSRGELVGLLTDRDICLAVAARRKTPWDLQAIEVMSRPVYTCLGTDSVDDALVVMAQHRVRRLPVMDKHGHVQGMLSLHDVERYTGEQPGRIAPVALADALRAIAAPRLRQAEFVSA